MVERIYSGRNIRQFRIEREFGSLSEPAKLIGNEDKSAREDEEEGRDEERNEKGDSTAGNSAIKSCAPPILLLFSRFIVSLSFRLPQIHRSVFPSPPPSSPSIHVLPLVAHRVTAYNKN